MIASPSPQPPVGDAAPACGITGHAVCTARLSGMAALREGGAPPGAPPLPARFLRHCDEHTVVGIHAVLRAITALPGPVDRASDAVVAAPCQAGRLMAAKSLCLLKTGGAVTVSTHIVPQASLHSTAGAVSVALGMHGPHMGVGGGADALAEGLLAAATLAGSPGVPRAWLVATEWDEEPALDPAGDPTSDPLCRAIALAIEAGGVGELGLEVHFSATPATAVEPTRLATFARALDACGPGGVLAAWTLNAPGGAEVRITRGGSHVRTFPGSEAGRRREAA